VAIPLEGNGKNWAKIDFKIRPYHQRGMKKIEICHENLKWKNLKNSFLKFEKKISVWNLKKIWPYHQRCVTCVCGIGVLLEVLSWWYKQNIWFLHFKCFYFPLMIWPFFFKFQTNFFFKFQKWKFQKNFISKFVAYFNLFHFPLVVWPNFKIDFCSIFSIFLLVVYPFFKIHKQKKNKFKFQKRFFSNF
jgi:hypothetical protein